MDINQDKDRNTLFGRAFDMGSKHGDTFDGLCDLLTDPAHKGNHKYIYVNEQWLINPYTSWSNDFGGVGQLICNELGAGRDIDRDLAALLYFVQDVPDEKEQDIIGESEFLVQAGNYDRFVKNHVKFQLQMKYLNESAEFAADLKLLCDLVELEDLAYNNVVRRTLACERNMRQDHFYLRWKNKLRRAQHVFDAFSWKHELYGLEKIDGKWTPLLMKVTVNATPHGIIIFIPKWMSLDLVRDLVTREISKLIRARGVKRQGSKRTEAQFEREELATEAYYADQAAADMGLKGDDRIDFIIQQLGLMPETDDRRIRELLAEGARVETDESRITPADVMAKMKTPAPETDFVQKLRAMYNRGTPEQREAFLKSIA